MLARVALAVGLAAGGCALEPGEADMDTDGETDGDTDPSEPVCAPAVSAQPTFGTIDVRIRNSTDEMVYVIGTSLELGDEPVPFQVYPEDGDAVERVASQCVPRCRADGVDCGTQCNGGEFVAIPLEAGAELQAQWNGLQPSQVELSDACAESVGCSDFCVDMVPAFGGTYEVGVRVATTCMTTGGDPCDCEACDVSATDVPELRAAVDLSPGAAVTLEYTGA